MKLGLGLSLLIAGLHSLVVYGSTASLSPKEVFKHVSPSIVSLTNMQGTSGGTGFTISTLGSYRNVIITNFHVCERYTEMLMNGKTLIPIIDRDFDHDLCLLEGQSGPPLELGSPPEQYDELFVVGHPYLEPNTPTSGYYIGERPSAVGMIRGFMDPCPEGTLRIDGFFYAICVKYYQLGQTTVATHPGNSGSPIVNSNGNVVGVINSGDTRTHNGGFIPVRFLVKFLQKN